MKSYEILESTSELRIRVFGSTLLDLFRNSLKAMFESVEPHYAKDQAQCKHPIAIKAPEKELLLIDFLSEALFYSDANNEAYDDVIFDNFAEDSFSAVLMGRKVTSFAIEIKAVTYHDVNIIENNDKLSVEILFDI